MKFRATPPGRVATTSTQKTVRISCLLLLACGLLQGVALAQSTAPESLGSILDRGYVAHWLVCGPFPSDLPGGILPAVREGAAPLGEVDFMAARGGPTRIRPQHLDIIEAPDGKDAIWQRAGAKGHALDLSPFYPNAEEGVTYAGFYARAAAPTTAYLELQTPLGARVWLNGYLLRDIRPVPILSAGNDHLIANFRAGDNFLLIQTPGAAFERIAEAVGMGERDLSARGFVNRTLLRGTSGHEIALRMRPAAVLGQVYYVPRLSPVGPLVRERGSPYQEAELTLFNASNAPSPDIAAAVRYAGIDAPAAARAGVLPGQSEKTLRLRIPTQDALPGTPLPVELTITAGDAATTFDTVLVLQPTADPGRVYFVTGGAIDSPSPLPPWQEQEQWNSAIARQTTLMGQEPDYGFLLGPAARWIAALRASPESVETVRAAALRGRVATSAVFAPTDPRFLSGEFMLRNHQLGHRFSENLLGEAPALWPGWEAPHIAPQLPQLAIALGANGLLSPVATPGLPPLARLIGLDGSAILLRRKEAAIGPISAPELRQMASVQRRELLDLGIQSDVILNSSAVLPPEPYLSGAVSALAAGAPAIRMQGNGAEAFFEDIARMPLSQREKLPLRSTPLTRTRPGDLLRAAPLAQASARVQHAYLQAETLATLSALLGAAYPGNGLALAERQVLGATAAISGGDVDSKDTEALILAKLREAAHSAVAFRNEATAFIAPLVDTLTTAPLETEGTRALVVFNTLSWTRTTLCETSITMGPQGAFRVFDDLGNPVPFMVDRFRQTGPRARQARLRFVASEVPPLGLRTYHLAPAIAFPQDVQRPDPSIENEHLTLHFDLASGEISALIDKAGNTSLPSGGLNRFFLLPASTTDDGGIATEANATHPKGPPVAVAIRRSDAHQEITLKHRFAGGILTRTVSLWAGLPEILFESSLEEASFPKQLIGMSFNLPEAGRVAVAGERFGALVMSRAAKVQDFSHDGRKDTTSSGLYPAWNWSAIAPGDLVETGITAGTFLRPVGIVHGGDPALAKAAESLQRALTSRGIPAVTLFDKLKAPDTLWRDGTGFDNHEEAVVEGARMRIVIGAPEQNDFMAQVLKAIPANAQRLFAERLPQGVELLVPDATATAGLGPLPTILLAGVTVEQSAAIAERAAESIAKRGRFSLPPSGVLGVEGEEPAEIGIALLHEGPLLTAQTATGALHVLLAEGERKDAGNTLSHSALSWRYALQPFAGTWQQGAPARAAESSNHPLVATLTDLHTGRLSPRTSLLQLDSPTAIAAAVRPPHPNSVIDLQSVTGPRDGFVLRGYNPGGLSSTAQLSAGFSLLQVSSADLLERPRGDIPTTRNGAALALKPFEVASWWLLPGTLPAQGAPRSSLAATTLALAGRYWAEGLPGAPEESAPLALILQGSLGPGESRVRARVLSLGAAEAEGVVRISAAPGWTVTPSEFYYHADMGEAHSQELTVLSAGAPSGPGGIVAETVYQDRRYRDVLMEKATPLEIEVSRTGGQVKVKAGNRTGIPWEGRVSLAAPTAFWPELSPDAPHSISPGSAPLSLPAYGDGELLFQFSTPDSRTPLRVVVAGNGQINFFEAPASGGAAAEAPPSPPPSGAFPQPPPPRSSPPAP